MALTREEEELAWLYAESDGRRPKNDEHGEDDFVWIEQHASSHLKEFIREKRAAAGGLIEWTHLVQQKHWTMFKNLVSDVKRKIGQGYRRVHGRIIPPEGMPAASAFRPIATAPPATPEAQEMVGPNDAVQSRRSSKQATLTDVEEELARLAEESKVRGKPRKTCDWDYIEEHASEKLMSALDDAGPHNRHKMNVIVPYRHTEAFKKRRAEISEELIQKHGDGHRKKANISTSIKPRKRKKSRDREASSPRKKQSPSLELNCFEEEIIMLGEESRLVEEGKNTYNWKYIKENASDRLRGEMERRNVFTGTCGTKLARITRVDSHRNFRPVFKKRQEEVRASLLPEEDIKDKHEVGDEVYARYKDDKYYQGTVTDCRVDSGGCRLYSVVFGCGDAADDLAEVFVFAKRDYINWMDRDQKGLSQGLLFRADPSKDADAWLHSRGWWQTELTGKENFGSITAAMRAYDKAFVRANGLGATRRKDLNFPDEHLSSNQGPSSVSRDASTSTSSSSVTPSTARVRRTSGPTRQERPENGGSSSGGGANNGVAMRRQVVEIESGSAFGVQESSRQAVAPALHSHRQQSSAGEFHRRALEKLKKSHTLQMDRFRSELRNIEEESSRYLGELETFVDNLSGSGDDDDEGGTLRRSLLLEDARETHDSHLERLNEQRGRLQEECRRYVDVTKKKFSRFLQSVEGQELV